MTVMITRVGTPFYMCKPCLYNMLVVLYHAVVDEPRLALRLADTHMDSINNSLNYKPTISDLQT